MIKAIVYRLSEFALVCSIGTGILLVGCAAPESTTVARWLVYGDSNSWGWNPPEGGEPPRRYARDVRWPGVLRSEVGAGIEIIEANLSGRTTNADGPEPWPVLQQTDFNGARHLPVALASHAPLDLVIVMLGTNDLKTGLDRDSQDVADGIEQLIDIIEESEGIGLVPGKPPKIMIIAPPPIGAMPAEFRNAYVNADVSSELGTAFEEVAMRRNIMYMDSGSVIGTAAGSDGLHLTAEQHRTLGETVARKLIAAFEREAVVQRRP